MHTSSVRTEGGGEEEGVTKKLVKKDFERLKVTGVLKGLATIQTEQQ